MIAFVLGKEGYYGILVVLLIGIIGNVIGTLVGGGGLITLPTMMLMGVPVHSAIGANKVSNMVSAFQAFIQFINVRN